MGMILRMIVFMCVVVIVLRLALGEQLHAKTRTNQAEAAAVDAITLLHDEPLSSTTREGTPTKAMFALRIYHNSTKHVCAESLHTGDGRELTRIAIDCPDATVHTEPHIYPQLSAVRKVLEWKPTPTSSEVHFVQITAKSARTNMCHLATLDNKEMTIITKHSGLCESE